MKRRYTVGRYVSVRYYDPTGAESDLYIPEAEVAYRIVCGRPLVLYPCVPYVRKVDLGIVREVRDYVKHRHAAVRTDEGWYYIEVNKPLEILLGDRVGWLEVLGE